MSVRCWFSNVSAFALCLALLFTAALARTQEPQSVLQSGTGAASQGAPSASSSAATSVRCIYGVPCNITGGQAVTWGLQSYCYINGVPQLDTVTFSLKGVPPGASSPPPCKNYFDPNPVHLTSNQPTPHTMCLTTERETKIKKYTLVPSAHGVICGDYPFTPSTTQLIVAPRIKGPSEVWWFNGVTPREWENKTKVTLTAIPSGEKSYFWTITDGADFAQFSNGETTKTTTNNTVKLELNSAPPGSPTGNCSTPPNNITVTVTVNNVSSAPFKLTGKMPASIKPNKPISDVPNLFSGYKSTIFYELDDQFGCVLPKDVDVREVFTLTTPIKDEDTNWNIGQLAGAHPNLSNPNGIHDVITGQSAITANGIPSPLPAIPCPGCPAWPVRVEHWCGYVEVGSQVEGKGVQVATLTWQKFVNHARHCDLASPPASFDPGDVPACPGVDEAACPTN
jgi:hypothetical protein